MKIRTRGSPLIRRFPARSPLAWAGSLVLGDERSTGQKMAFPNLSGPESSSYWFVLPFFSCLRLFIQRSEEHTSELQSLMRISYAVFCLKKKNKNNHF